MENSRIRKRLARERKVRALLLLAVFWAVFLSIYNPLIDDVHAVRALGNTWTQSLDLSGGVTVSQEIRYEYDGFKALEIWLTQTRSVNNKLLVTLKELPSGKLIFKDTVYSANIIKNNKAYRLRFDEQKSSAGKTYLLTIKNAGPSGSGLFVQLADLSDLTVPAVREGKNAGGSIMMDTFFCDDTVRQLYLIMWGIVIAMSFVCALLVGNEWHRNFLVIAISV